MTLPRAHVRFRETMEGTWRAPGSDEDRAISFTVTVLVDDLASRLRDGRGDLDGYLTMAGVAQASPARGTIHIRPFERLIRYQLEFQADDGRALTLAGQKNLRLLALLDTMTHMDAAVTAADGAEVGTARLRFDPRSELLPMLLSFRASVAR